MRPTTVSTALPLDDSYRSCPLLAVVRTGRPPIGEGPSTPGRISAEPPRAKLRVAAAGGGHAFGQSDPARSSRILCPGSEIQEVISSSTSARDSVPGSGGGGGARDA